MTEITLFFANDEQMINQWLTSAMPALGGRVVRDLIKTNDGRKEVRAILEVMRYGDFC